MNYLFVLLFSDQYGDTGEVVQLAFWALALVGTSNN